MSTEQNETEEATQGLALEPYQVVLRPLVTEKGTHISERYNAYTFAVNPLATKTDIKKAVQELWDVRVVKIRTQNRKGKPRRHKISKGRTKDWKKAIVELHEDDRISFF
ncbi:50S ribosomal protein L23 [Thalassoroseus pseudoceratinae]|uniref:50S ribosomal protein L23 n=1 Tax=Thalassoroseus pseudoceratinae TaxID=2713176 RepID=UPI00141FDD1A|nr:50S ribosomal protein L23 [Thalassoroseus pseudoceratinae]